MKKRKISLKMLKIALGIVMIFGAVSCSKDTGTISVDKQLQIKTSTEQIASRSASVFGWGGSDNNAVLETSVWSPAKFSYPINYYSYFSDYDFSPYYINGETTYDATKYDLMCHFGYTSPEAVSGAVVEFTFPQISYFVPHIDNENKHRIFTVNNANNQTVISCTTNLVAGVNPMFCFIVKADCGKGKSGFATIWTDMKINGVSVKGTIANKVFKCS